MARALFVVALTVLGLIFLPHWPVRVAADSSGQGPGDARIVWIASGSFTMGATLDDVEHARRLCVSERMPSALRLRGCASDELFSNETPARRVFVSAYGMDRYEVTRAEHEACIERGACAPAWRDSTH